MYNHYNLLNYFNSLFILRYNLGDLVKSNYGGLTYNNLVTNFADVASAMKEVKVKPFSFDQLKTAWAPSIFWFV